MLKNLPTFVQKQVFNYLASNNLSGAKSLHDAWLRHQTKCSYCNARSSESYSCASFLIGQQEILLERIFSSDPVIQ